MKTMEQIGYWKNRPGKEEARDRFLSFSPKNVSVYFTFPGVDCIDIKRAIHLGVIGKRTFIIAVEKRKANFSKIKSYLDSIKSEYGIEYHFHNSELKDFQYLEDALNGKKIDCAFFDYCGPITESDILWIMENQKSFAEKACIAYTITNHIRHHEYMDRICRFMKKYKNSFVQKFCENSVSNTEFIFHTRETADYFYVNKNKKVIKRRIGYNELSQKILSVVFGIEYNIEKVFSYRDTKHGMSVFLGCLNNRKSTKRISDKLWDLYSEKKYVKKNKKNLEPIEEIKRKELVSMLIKRGIKNKGIIRATRGEKAYLTRLCNSKETKITSITMQWAGIKAEISRCGYKAEVITE